MKIVSWNLRHSVGAPIPEVVALIAAERPDLLLLQETTAGFESLPDLTGGWFARCPLPGRGHGLAAWSPRPVSSVALTLPSGVIVRRVAQILSFDGFAVANVHLSHGQRLNRMQLRWLARFLPPRAAIIGDFNMVGAALLPGFADAGPRQATHAAAGVARLRLDRCLVRGLWVQEAAALPRGGSDHRPIVIRLGSG